MDERQPLLLFADGDLAWSLPLRKRLSERGLGIDTVSTAKELLERLDRRKPDLVILGDRLDDLGGRLVGGLVQERSPATRIIRVVPAGGLASADEPAPADNVLCSVSRRTAVDEFARIVMRVLGSAPRRTLAARPPLVVCLDDDELFVQSLSRVLRRQGFRVLSYTEPEIALEELPLVKPDLMILDVLMPGLSGFEVLTEIRRFHLGSLPVILLSALDGDARFLEGRHRGAACYLTKPCPPEILVETVRRVLGAPVTSS